MRQFILLLVLTTFSNSGFTQLSERLNGIELGVGFSSKLNTTPPVGLPKTSLYLGYRRENKYEQYPSISLISGVQGWLPRKGTDQVTLLKDESGFDNRSLPSEVLIGYLEGHFALKYTFKNNSELKPYVGMGIGIVVAPFQETLEDFSDFPDGYSLPDFYNDGKYGGIMIGINVNALFGVELALNEKVSFFESYIHLPARGPLGEPYEMSLPAMLGFRLGLMFR